MTFFYNLRCNSKAAGQIDDEFARRGVEDGDVTLTSGRGLKHRMKVG